MGLREKAHRLLFVQRLGMLQDVYDQAKEDVADKDRANQNNPEHYERSALPHSLLILHRIRRIANTTFGERGLPFRFISFSDTAIVAFAPCLA
jgi:hypothetical protein